MVEGARATSGSPRSAVVEVSGAFCSSPNASEIPNPREHVSLQAAWKAQDAIHVAVETAMAEVAVAEAAEAHDSRRVEEADTAAWEFADTSRQRETAEALERVRDAWARSDEFAVEEEVQWLDRQRTHARNVALAMEECALDEETARMELQEVRLQSKQYVFEAAAEEERCFEELVELREDLAQLDLELTSFEVGLWAAHIEHSRARAEEKATQLRQMQAGWMAEIVREEAAVAELTEMQSKVSIDSEVERTLWNKRAFNELEILREKLDESQQKRVERVRNEWTLKQQTARDELQRAVDAKQTHAQRSVVIEATRGEVAILQLLHLELNRKVAMARELEDQSENSSVHTMISSFERRCDADTVATARKNINAAFLRLGLTKCQDKQGAGTRSCTVGSTSSPKLPNAAMLPAPSANNFTA